MLYMWCVWLLIVIMKLEYIVLNVFFFLYKPINDVLIFIGHSLRVNSCATNRETGRTSISLRNIFVLLEDLSFSIIIYLINISLLPELVEGDLDGAQMDFDRRRGEGSPIGNTLEGQQMAIQLEYPLLWI